MTISSTRTRELSIDKIVLLAYRHAGLLNETQGASETKKAAARDVLETIVDELQIKGLYARSIVFETVQLTTGSENATLSTNVFDVIDAGAYISATDPDPTHAQGETVVQQIDRAEWQRISDKGATGRPALFYTDRTVFPVKVVVWPLPDEAGLIRFQVHRLGADVENGAATPDLERFWAQYLIWELAHQLALANSINPVKVQYLGSVAAAKLVECRAYANPRTSQQMYVDHRQGWTR